MLDEGFAEAWINSTHWVLGLKLRPFSLWHRLQLNMLDSPVLTGKTVLPLDLEQAVQACRLEYPQSVIAKINWWSFRWRLAGKNFTNEVQKFGVYLSDFYSIPKFIPPTIKKDLSSINTNNPPPEEIRIFSSISTMTGWSEKKIWNLPIGQAYWYAAGHWYQSGQELDFLTPEHLVLQQRIAAMKAAKQNG